MSICFEYHPVTRAQCRAELLWLVLDTGKRMPVDAQPSDQGNVAAMRDANGVWVGHVLRAGENPMPGERRYVPHFATCIPSIEGRKLAAQRKREDRLVDASPNVVRLRDGR